MGLARHLRAILPQVLRGTCSRLPQTPFILLPTRLHGQHAPPDANQRRTHRQAPRDQERRAGHRKDFHEQASRLSRELAGIEDYQRIRAKVLSYDKN